MTMTVETINAAVEAARAAAASAVPATVAPTTTAVAPLAQGGRPVSMREMVQEAGIRPDHFLKVNEFGILIGKDLKNFQDEIEVEFRLSAPKPYYAIRFGNSPTKYLKSYDRMVESRSKKAWSQCIAEAMAADPKCTGDYASLDLLATLTKPVTGKGDVVLAEAGQTVGFSCSVTNWSYWVAFIEPYYKLMDDGYLSPDALVRGKLTCLVRTGNGNTWGVFDFKDFTVVDESQTA